jgi:hypothetical protein
MRYSAHLPAAAGQGKLALAVACVRLFLAVRAAFENHAVVDHLPVARIMYLFEEMVPPWLSPREKYRPHVAACVVRMMR